MLDVEKNPPDDVGDDPFYSEANIRYPEKTAQKIANGQARFAGHELMEVEEE